MLGDMMTIGDLLFVDPEVALAVVTGNAVVLEAEIEEEVVQEVGIEEEVVQGAEIVEEELDLVAKIAEEDVARLRRDLEEDLLLVQFLDLPEEVNRDLLSEIVLNLDHLPLREIKRIGIEAVAEVEVATRNLYRDLLIIMEMVKLRAAALLLNRLRQMALQNIKFIHRKMKIDPLMMETDLLRTKLTHLNRGADRGVAPEVLETALQVLNDCFIRVYYNYDT